MRTVLSVLIFVMWNCCVLAQQKPHYTQYIQNQYIINPALSGIEMYTDVNISHRHQWLGIDDGPITTYLSIQGPIGNRSFKTVPSSMRQRDVNPRGKEFWDEYKASNAHHGWGVQVINDRTGPLKNFTAQLTYAYHMPLSDALNIAAGIGIGVNQVRLDASRLKFAVTVDPAVNTSGILNKIRPDFTAGIYLYSPTFFGGISAQQIVPQKIEFANNTARTIDGKSVPHFFAIAGYRTMLGDDFNLIPSVMVKYVQPSPIQVEGNVKLQYRDLLWVGGSYRQNDGFAGMAGLNVSSAISVGYSYDHTLTDLRTFSKGTHEVLVSFRLKNKEGDSCPRNVW